MLSRSVHLPARGEASRGLLQRILFHRWTLALLVCLLVVESRFYTIKRFGVQEPFMDGFGQIPVFEAVVHNDPGELWETTLTPNNEHRIIVTHWSNIGLFLLNGKKWDLLVEACLNALLAGCLVAALFAGLGRHLGGVEFLFFSFLLLLAFGLPVSFENILWGFQSQHFYFLLFSVIAIASMVGGKPVSWAWWCGLLAGVLACLTLASGFYALLCTSFVYALMAFRREYRSRRLLLCAGVCLLLAGIAVPTLVGPHSGDKFAAHSLFQFLSALMGNLAWPNIKPAQRLWSILMQLPVLALGMALLVRQKTLPRSSYVIVGLGVWNLMIALSLSYYRVYSPYYRYFDYNAFNIVVNGAALLELSRHQLFPRMPKVVRLGLFVCWLVAAIAGCYDLADQAWRQGLPSRKAELLTEQSAIKELFRTHDPQSLLAPSLNGVFPFIKETAEDTASELTKPEVYQFLPNSMKPEFGTLDDREPLSELRRVLLRRSDYILAGLIFLTIIPIYGILSTSGVVRGWFRVLVDALTP